MTPQERDVVSLFRTNFFLFAYKAFSILNPGTSFSATPGFMAVAQAFAQVVTGETKRLLVMVPPRSGKSILGSIALPAYMLGRDPTRRILCASYSGDLASSLHRQFRTLMTSDFYMRLFPGVGIAKNTDTEFNTHSGGTRIATSVGGTLTGLGGNLIVIDDPLKPMDAMSATARDAAWDWFTGTVQSRLDNKSEDKIVVIMQRLHVDDLAGRLIDQGGWQQLTIPAIAETRQELKITRDRAIIREPGHVLDPQREPRETLEQLRRDLGSATFEAQYQQQPVPEEGGMVQWRWFETYNVVPRRDPGDWLVISWDTAMKASQLNDYSVGIVALIKPNNNVYILDLIRERLDFPALRKRVIDEARQRRATITLIEDAGSGTSLLQDLRNQIGVSPIRPFEEKAVRFHRCTPVIEGKQVHIPADAPWMQAFKREVLTFPNSANDDQVDALSQLLNWSRERTQNQILQSRYSAR